MARERPAGAAAVPARRPGGPSLRARGEVSRQEAAQGGGGGSAGFGLRPGGSGRGAPWARKRLRRLPDPPSSFPAGRGRGAQLRGGALPLGGCAGWEARGAGLGTPEAGGARGAPGMLCGRRGGRLFPPRRSAPDARGFVSLQAPPALRGCHGRAGGAGAAGAARDGVRHLLREL